MNCINCQIEVDSKFCSNCGQPHPPKKLGLGNLWYDFQSRIYGFDGMFPRTIKDLTIRPGAASKEYIRGNRVMYYGPVGYFFLMITTYLLLASILDIDVKDFLKTSGSLVQKPQPGSGQAKFQQMILNLISDNMKIFSFLIIPFQAFTAMIFFRKSAYNFIEHAVLPLFVTGHAFWLSIGALFLYKFFGPSSYQIWMSLLGIILYIIGCVAFYDYQSKIKVIFKSIGVYIMSYLFYVIFLMLVIGVYILSNPALVEMIRPSNNR